MKPHSSPVLPLCLVAALMVPATAILRGADWPDWRGPARTGVSAETGLPSTWSVAGENLAWKVHVGGRSGPVVLGDHLYLQNTSGAGELEQERIMCFNADTGKLLWEHKYNMFASDVPAHRLAWSSPVVDPATGNVFAISGGGLVMALSKDGKPWGDRSTGDGHVTTHGGGCRRPSSGNCRERPDLQQGSSRATRRIISFDRSNGGSSGSALRRDAPDRHDYANPRVADVDARARCSRAAATARCSPQDRDGGDLDLGMSSAA